MSSAISFNENFVWSLVGLMAFLIAYYFWSNYLRSSNSFIRFIPKPINLSQMRNIRHVETIAYLSFILILGIYTVYMTKIGGIINFINNWNHLRFSAGSGRTTLWFTFFMLQPIVWVVSICYISKTRYRKSRVSLIGLILTTVTASIILFTTGSRASLILFWVGIMVIYHYIVKPISFRKLAIIVGFLIVFAVSAGRLRHYLSSGTPFYRTGNGLVMKVLDYGLRDFTFVDLSYFYMSHVPEEHDYLWGRSLTDIPTFVIPRKIWACKPLILGPSIVLRYFFPKFRPNTHISPSLLGDLYINFSYPGIIVGMALLGIFCQTVERNIKNLAEHPERTLIPICTIAFFFFLFKSGLFGGFVRISIIYILPLFVLLNISKFIRFQKPQLLEDDTSQSA